MLYYDAAIKRTVGEELHRRKASTPSSASVFGTHLSRKVAGAVGDAAPELARLVPPAIAAVGAEHLPVVTDNAL